MCICLHSYCLFIILTTVLSDYSEPTIIDETNFDNDIQDIAAKGLRTFKAHNLKPGHDVTKQGHDVTGQGRIRKMIFKPTKETIDPVNLGLSRHIGFGGIAPQKQNWEMQPPSASWQPQVGVIGQQVTIFFSDCI